MRLFLPLAGLVVGSQYDRCSDCESYCFIMRWEENVAFGFCNTQQDYEYDVEYGLCHESESPLHCYLNLNKGNVCDRKGL